MPDKVAIDVGEYLATSFDGADCDYLEGEIEERNTGQALHGRIQLWISVLLLRLNLGLDIIPEIRVRVDERRYRVADVGVWRRGSNIGTDTPNTPPFLVVEVLSPDDRIVRMTPRVHDYLKAGVEWIWIVDPWEGQALIHSQSDPGGQAVTVLATATPLIQLPLEIVLNPEF